MADQKPIGAEKTLASEVRQITDGATFPANPKRVIRTYAADVAKLTGAPASASALPSTPKLAPMAPRPAQPLPPPPPPPPPPPKPIPPPTPINLINAVPPEPHLPPLKKPAAIVPLKMPSAVPSAKPSATGEWERVISKKEPSFFTKLFWSIFGNAPTPPAPAPRPVIAPSTPMWPKSAQPAVSEPNAPSFKPSTAAESEAKEREAVLARLRSRVTTYQAQNPAPPPVFPTPRPESAPVRPPAPAPVPVPAPQPAVPERLHTYTGDFANRIDTQQASTFSVYAAQADAGGVRSAPEPKRQHAGLAYALSGATLVIGGSLLLYFGYTYFSGTQPVPVITTAPPALISGDDQAAVSGQGSALMGSLVSAAGNGIPAGTMRILYYAATATSTEPGGALIRALALPAPDILLRNLGENSTVGVLNAGNESHIFFVLAATSYERTFAGMLSWEPTMGSDLSPLYPPYPAESAATSTATSTAAKNPPPASAPASAPRFYDEVVDSHDVRALKDSEGRTLLLYGFRDQNTLVIARDETAFSVILARLSATHTQ